MQNFHKPWVSFNNIIIEIVIVIIYFLLDILILIFLLEGIWLGTIRPSMFISLLIEILSFSIIWFNCWFFSLWSFNCRSKRLILLMFCKIIYYKLLIWSSWFPITCFWFWFWLLCKPTFRASVKTFVFWWFLYILNPH